jgi:D-hexose-6-phosphate mutarotase
MNRPKYKEMYLKEKNKKEHYRSYITTILDRLQIMGLNVIDEVRVFDNRLYRTIEIKHEKQSAQMVFLWEGKDE